MLQRFLSYDLIHFFVLGGGGGASLLSVQQSRENMRPWEQFRFRELFLDSLLQFILCIQNLPIALMLLASYLFVMASIYIVQGKKNL